MAVQSKGSERKTIVLTACLTPGGNPLGILPPTHIAKKKETRKRSLGHPPTIPEQKPFYTDPAWGIMLPHPHLGGVVLFPKTIPCQPLITCAINTFLITSTPTRTPP